MTNLRRNKREKWTSSEQFGAKWVRPIEPEERDFKRRGNNRLLIKEAAFGKIYIYHHTHKMKN